MKKNYPPISLVLLAAGLLAGPGCSRPDNRTIVRNFSGHTVSNITLNLMTLDDSWQDSAQAMVLESGKRLVLSHRQNDTRLSLSYDLQGISTNHFTNYVDLWSGEGWMVDIQPDGRVIAGYETQ